jgi:putative endonuclease
MDIILISLLNILYERINEMHNLNRNIGTLGEIIAEKFLLKQGCKILERNFTCKLGEIDIIAIDKDYIVFTEVKTRYDNFYGSPAESVTAYKQFRIYKAAQVYIMFKKLHDFNFRFDVIEIKLDKDSSDYTLRLIKNAFQI